MVQLTINIYKYSYLILLKGSFFLYDLVFMMTVNDSSQLFVSDISRGKLIAI
jgi:hypothetical protein